MNHGTLLGRSWAVVALGLSSLAGHAQVVTWTGLGSDNYTDTAATDLQNMLVAHSYAGWLIFLAWTALFWGLLFRFLPIREAASPSKEGVEASSEPPTRVRHEAKCAICQGALSPAVPAERCACGEYLHSTCFRSTGKCPSCGRPPEFTVSASPETV